MTERRLEFRRSLEQTNQRAELKILKRETILSKFLNKNSNHAGKVTIKLSIF